MPAHPAFILSALLVFLGSGALRGWPGAFVAVPSTLLHEFCHYIVAYVSGSRPAPMDIVPKKVGDEWLLGSVSFQAGWFSAAFVALAPLLLLLAAWALWPEASSGGWVQNAWRGTGFGWCLIGAWPSRTDWGLAFRYPIGLLFAGAVGALFLHIAQVP